MNVAAVVEINTEFAIGQLVNDAAHALFGVVLHMLHVRDDDLTPEVLDHPGQLSSALVAARYLRAQIGDVLRHVAHWMRIAGQNFHQLVLEEHALANKLHVVEQHALLTDVFGKRRH